MDDFDFIFDNFTESDFAKVITLFFHLLEQVMSLQHNYGMDMETLTDIFTAKKFNWERENSDQFNNFKAPFDIVFAQVK